MDYQLDNLRLDPDYTGCFLVKDDDEGVAITIGHDSYHWDYDPNYP